jgi:hypothetical protein
MPKGVRIVIKAKSKKDILLELARTLQPRPHHTTVLGRNLISYISPSQGSFDPAFLLELNSIPYKDESWDINHKISEKKVPEKKAICLKLAKEGKPKPHLKTELGSSLHRYIAPSHKSYDPMFCRQLKEIKNKHETWDRLQL